MIDPNSKYIIIRARSPLRSRMRFKRGCIKGPLITNFAAVTFASYRVFVQRDGRYGIRYSSRSDDRTSEARSACASDRAQNEKGARPGVSLALRAFWPPIIEPMKLPNAGTGHDHRDNDRPDRRIERQDGLQN
jgi:hypothetical protein